MNTNWNNFGNGEEVITKTVNWHITSKCNYRCKFCSANEFDYEINNLEQVFTVLKKVKRIYLSLNDLCINLSGGEPTLHPFFYEILKEIKCTGIPVWVSTNGSTINRENIKKIARYADGITISVDSISNVKEKNLGRGFGNHVGNVLEVSDLIHRTGIKLGIKTIVTKINCGDNLRPLIHRINPHRWIILQRFPGPYQNNAFINQMSNDYNFNEFMRKHSHVRLRDGMKPSFQKTEDILKSYLILSSEGIIKNWNETVKVKND